MYAPGADSRDYRFCFEIASAAEAPPDFIVPADAADAIAGLFLPRDEPVWFGRSTPPRVLLLSASSLTLLSHSAAALTPVTIPLKDVSIVESGHALLIGWIRILFGASAVTLPYNARSRRPVENFMRRVRQLTFPIAGSGGSEHAFGPPLDIKFTNARASELDPGETIATSFFAAPAERPRRFGWLSFRSSLPGDFVAVTNRRILWISDRIRNHYDRYGIVIRYGRLETVSAMACPEDKRELAVSFTSGQVWSIPIREESLAAARLFTAKAAAALLQGQLM